MNNLNLVNWITAYIHSTHFNFTLNPLLLVIYNETKAPGTQGTQLANVTILTKPVEIREGKLFYEERIIELVWCHLTTICSILFQKSLIYNNNGHSRFIVISHLLTNLLTVQHPMFDILDT